MACVLCVPSVIEIVIKSLGEWQEGRDRVGDGDGETTTAGDYCKTQFMALRAEIKRGKAWRSLLQFMSCKQRAGKGTGKGRGRGTHMIHEMS